MPRREIDALWCLVGWFSSTPTLIESDCTKMRHLLTFMIESNCGILTKDVAPNGHPPNPLHIEACCIEIKRIAILISSKSLTTDLDSFISTLTEKSLQLDSRNKTIDASSSNASLDAAMSKYWDEIAISPNPQIENYARCRFTFELSTMLIADTTDETWGLVPSTHLIQTCCYILKQYAMLAMQKKPKWVRFNRSIDAVIINLLNEKEVQSKPVDEFAAAFSVIGQLNQKEVNSIIPYFRESSCFIILSFLLARIGSTSLASHVNIGLNKSTREKVSSICEISCMCLVQNHLTLNQLLCTASSPIIGCYNIGLPPALLANRARNSPIVQSKFALTACHCQSHVPCYDSSSVC